MWHTRFGLDETSFSMPHAMLGHGILIALLGFVACRLAIGPLRWWSAGLLALLLLGVSIDLIGGPILRNPPPSGLQAIAAIPVLVRRRRFSAHHADLSRPASRPDEPAVLPLIAFTVGFGLRLAQRLTGPRDRWLVLLAGVSLALAALDDLGPR